MTGQDPEQRRVALVTGASRGVGRGVATALGAAGWTVYVTGRGPAGPGSPLNDTVELIGAGGGVGHAVVCDHRDDTQVTALIDRCVREQGQLDLLVNNVWVAPEIDMNDEQRVWERPLSDWDSLIGVGLRAHFVASVAACGVMVPRKSGLIVNISSFGARQYLHSVLYGISKTGLDKMTNDMARELLPHGVSVLSLWPGLVLTEALLATDIDSIAGVPVTDGETPEFQGRVIAALANDPAVHELTGQALVSAEAGERYGVLESDGRRPRSLRDVFGGGPLFAPIHAIEG